MNLTIRDADFKFLPKSVTAGATAARAPASESVDIQGVWPPPRRRRSVELE